MLNILKIAIRNLARFGRRTLLTSSLITLGIVGVLLFVAVSGSFKSIMIGQFTDSMLGHLEVHRKGYVASIDSLPLNLNMQPTMIGKVEQALSKMDAVEAYAPRVKFGAMFSNFTETTSIRISGIDPAKEAATTPMLPGRVVEGSKEGTLVKPGEILIPVLIARSFKVKVGDTVVLVATNRDGSVNGKIFTVKAALESISGPGGIREIGTISAIGTPPRRVLALFITEGLLLGLGGAALGTAISLAAIYVLNVWKISTKFGMQQNIVLSPAVSATDIVTIASMVVIMALLASLQPAWKASRMDPVTALGHV